MHATDAKRRMMRETDAHISRLTGQLFGPAYLDGLMVDPTSLWWSRPTVAAVLAAEAMRSGAGLAMIGAIQRAHYVEGRRVVDDDTLVEAARARAGRRRLSPNARGGAHRPPHPGNARADAALRAARFPQLPPGAGGRP